MAPETAKVVPLTCHGHSRPVTHISFSAVTDDDQYYLISACKGLLAKVWDTHTGEALHTLQHNHIVRAVAFPSHPSPSLLATGGAEKKLRIFDIGHTDATPTPTPTTLSHPNGTSSTATTNGHTAAQPSSYELGPGVHEGTIKSIIWAPHDPNIFVTAADDKKLRWWDLRARSVIGTHELDAQITSCELSTTSPGSTSSTLNSGLLSVAAGKSVHFFDSGASSPGAASRTHKLPQEAASVAVNMAERKFVTGGGGDTWVRVYDLDSGEELEIGKGHHGPVWSVCFSPDGKLYATGSEDGTLRLWKFTQGQYGLWR
ncbi:MAG: hypothetical protein M1828_002715 [Chrysothrix sp. TS-e1954]|nr:MAG: hypothetical protein M1828_002715 [Chrysothrix sp. TS-e1954]